MTMKMMILITLISVVSFQVKAQKKKVKIGNPVEAGFVQFVKFKSQLDDSLVLKIIDERKFQFMKVPGLIQKFYLKDTITGEFSGIYFWRNQEDYLNFKKTELGQTLSSAYKTQGKPRVELFKILFPLRDGK